MTFLQKRPVFFTNTQKHYFLVFFWNIISPFFHVFSFSFSTIKKTKTKSAHFFRKPFFDTLTNCPKIIFAPLHTICVFFFKIPQKHYKIGEKQAKKILDQVLTQPWTKFWRKKKKQILDQVLTLQHIHIYIYICCRVKIWSKIWGF